MSLNNSVLAQPMYTYNYSLAIDYDQIIFIVSLSIFCPYNLSEPYIQLGFYTDQLTSSPGNNSYITFLRKLYIFICVISLFSFFNDFS